HALVAAGAAALRRVVVEAVVDDAVAVVVEVVADLHAAVGRRALVLAPGRLLVIGVVEARLAVGGRVERAGAGLPFGAVGLEELARLAGLAAVVDVGHLVDVLVDVTVAVVVEPVARLDAAVGREARVLAPVRRDVVEVVEAGEALDELALAVVAHVLGARLGA